MPSHPPIQDVSILVEQDGTDTNKYKIQSDKLQEIGAQLRGRREFSIFHNIILPVGATLLTLGFTSLFQYVSWYNSIEVQRATDVADKATRAYENSAAAIGARHYATFVFVPSLRDLIEAKAKTVLSHMAQDKGTKKRVVVFTQANSKEQNPGVKRSPPGEMAQSTEQPKDDDISLHKNALDIREKRFASYYTQLKLWNENYYRLLTDIEYTLDRPVFASAGKKIQNSPFSKSLWDKMAEINCSNPVTDELKKLRVNENSLKFRFAAINWCFVEVHNGLDKLMDGALKTPRPSLDDLTQSKIKSQLEALLAMADEFRCYAQQRIDYYNSQKELAIVSPKNARTWLIDITRKEGSTSTRARRAQKHFKDAAGRCAPTLNPDFARAASTS
jgi:hypothetical protein